MYNTWVEISKSALKYNLQQLKKKVGPEIKIIAVVKSNAYGHGLIGVSKIIAPKIDMLAVISIEEALELRKAKIKKPLLIMSRLPDDRLAEAIKMDISLTVFDKENVQDISKIARKLRKQAKIHLKVDTGMGRLGLLPDDLLNFVKFVKKLPKIEIEGIFSHFALADLAEQSYVRKQLRKFQLILNEIGRQGISIPLIHLANSAALISFPESYMNCVRPGIAIYGLNPSTDKKFNIPFKLKPVLTWKAKIIQIKVLSKGSCISYGCTFKTKKRTKVAVIPCGYYEGYDRLLSNPPTGKEKGKGEVLIRGKKCKVLGRICMNFFVTDVSGISKVKVGDEVVLIGRQGREEITADEIAKKIGTINYEVVTRINPLIPRIYV